MAGRDSGDFDEREGGGGEKRGESEAGPHHGEAQSAHSQNSGDPGKDRVLLEVLQVIH